MATWEQDEWASSIESGLPRRDRRSGTYRRYVPDTLLGSPLLLPPDVDQLVGRAEQAVRGLSGDARDLAGIARFLLRSEAIASSRIEGIAPSVQQVALAELGAQEAVPDVSAQAQLVANNMTVLHEARTVLVAAPQVTVEHLLELHSALLPDEPQHRGVRTVQNWIGGSDHHPLDADFVPPPRNTFRRCSMTSSATSTEVGTRPLSRPASRTPSSKRSIRSLTATDASAAPSSTPCSPDAGSPPRRYCRSA